MKKPILILGIIFLLIGVNVEAISNDRLEENSCNLNIKKSLEFNEKPLSRGKTAYAYNTYASGISEGLVKFDLEDPENISFLAPTVSGDFLTGGTWANGYGWLAVEYGSGVLWKIDIDTGDMYSIGGGGQSLRDLAWDDYTWKLYSIGNCNDFFEIDPETGQSDLIDVNDSGCIVSFAFNSQGICYGIDILTDSLHIINISTGDVTFIANLSISLDYYSNYISFDKDNDILYLLTDSLYICNTENGECTFIGSFGGLALSAFAIPYNYNSSPVTTISFDPPEPDGNHDWYISNVTVILNATDEDGVNATYYRIDSGEWDTYDAPFIIYKEGKNILIEFYSVDNLDNYEAIKSETIKIDKTPPEIIINISKIKEGWQKWWIIVTVTFADNISGAASSSMHIVEFYLNDVLQDTVTGPGPEYVWQFLYSGGLRITIGVSAGVCDLAGNCDDVYNETKIYFSRNKNQLLNNQLFLRLLNHFPLLQLSLDVWRHVLL